MTILAFPPSLKRAMLFIFIMINMMTYATPEAGKADSYTLVKSFSADEIKQFFTEQHVPTFILKAKAGLKVYEVVYHTLYVDSTITQVSGLLFVPQGAKKPSPLLLYNHGTDLCHDRCFDGTGEQAICLGFATDGYIVLCPDYIGIGRSDKHQLYLNAPTEAQTSVDMLLASTELLPALGANPGKELFVTGYSQGGHAAMATYRLLQEKYKDRFPVTAASPMSGPYDVENTVYTSRNRQYDHPGYLMFLLSSYYETKGDQNKMREVLTAPYDSLITSMMDGAWPMDVIDAHLPDTVFKIVAPDFYKSFEQDVNSPFRKYLASNNVYDWKPEAPMQLCYCKGDDQVPYRNSVKAYETMKKNGSKNVELWHAGRKFKHVNCALFAVIYTKMFFDGFLDGHPRSHGPFFKRIVLAMGKVLVRP